MRLSDEERGRFIDISLSVRDRARYITDGVLFYNKDLTDDDVDSFHYTLEIEFNRLETLVEELRRAKR